MRMNIHNSDRSQSAFFTEPNLVSISIQKILLRNKDRRMLTSNLGTRETFDEKIEVFLFP